jgi:hypothetical protein
MGMRCPVCRAGDNQGAQCRRCKADLSLLLRLEASRSRLLAQAAQAAARADGATCAALAGRAHQLEGDDVSLRAVALGALLERDFARAWASYGRILAREV